jgi:hypothetical protein
MCTPSKDVAIIAIIIAARNLRTYSTISSVPNAFRGEWHHLWLNVELELRDELTSILVPRRGDVLTNWKTRSYAYVGLTCF